MSTSSHFRSRSTWHGTVSTSPTNACGHHVTTRRLLPACCSHQPYHHPPHDAARCNSSAARLHNAPRPDLAAPTRQAPATGPAERSALKVTVRRLSAQWCSGAGRSVPGSFAAPRLKVDSETAPSVGK